MAMKRMRAPKPNRKGVYEVHDVIARHVPRRLSQGWTFVEQKSVDISGPWMAARAVVKDELGKLPGSKSEAIEMLREAGYEVIDGSDR